MENAQWHLQKGRPAEARAFRWRSGTAASAGSTPQDREQDERGEWHGVQNDVTDGFVAAFNLAGTEHGYMRFPKGAAPETVMVPMGEDIGEMPDGENWQEGLRLQVKMPGEDFWRTLMSSAIGLWRSLDRLDD